MTTGIVIFNEAAFLARYPQFSAWVSANPGQLQVRFDEVTMLYVANTATALIQSIEERAVVINYAIAHTLQLDGVLASGGQGSTAGQVGRVSSGTQGSVTASLDMGAVPGTAAWWLQTQYGAMFWNATAKYRTFRYARAPHLCRR